MPPPVTTTGVPIGRLRIGRCLHAPRRVDAADQRRMAQDFAASGDGQRILEVHRGPFDPHGHLARRELIEGQGLQAGAMTGRILMNTEGVEGGHGLSFLLVVNSG